MRCHYDVLGVERDADEDELKRAYRKMALVHHPDKNPGREEEAAEAFKMVKAAHAVLTDPHERAWYDSHREAILSGRDPSQTAGDSDAEDFDPSVNLWPYFSSSCFDGFDAKEENGESFFAVFDDIFHRVAQEEERGRAEAARAGGKGRGKRGPARADDDFPRFGGPAAAWEDVSSFYRIWSNYTSQRSFAWADKWKLSDAPNRPVRRAMEAENKKARDKKRRKRIDLVRELVEFVRKRDPRIAKRREEEDARRKQLAAEREAARKEASAEFNADQERLAAESWAQLQELSSRHFHDIDFSSEEERGSANESGEAEDEEALYCAACNKHFKSVQQWQNHEQSKAHKAKLKTLLAEVIVDGVDNSVAGTVSSEGDSAEEVSSVLGAMAKSRRRRRKKAAKKMSSGFTPFAAPDFSDDDDDDDDDKEPSLEVEGDASLQDGADLESTDQDGTDQNKSSAASEGATASLGDAGDAGAPSAADTQPQNIPDTGETASPQPKGKRRRRAPKAKRQAQQQAAAAAAGGKKQNASAAAPPAGNRCGKCGMTFASRTKLFAHIKASGHALLK